MRFALIKYKLIILQVIKYIYLPSMKKEGVIKKITFSVPYKGYGMCGFRLFIVFRAVNLDGVGLVDLV